MTASARPRHGLKLLAAVLFPLTLILALLALDEPAAVSAWTRASQAIQTAATGAWTAARGQWTRSVSPSAPASVSGDAVLQGGFSAADDRTRNLTGDVDFVRAELRFAEMPTQQAIDVLQKLRADSGARVATLSIKRGKSLGLVLIVVEMERSA